MLPFCRYPARRGGAGVARRDVVGIQAKGLEVMTMSKKQDIEEQAAQWAAGLMSGDNRMHAGEDLADWQEEDPCHAKAYDELMAMTAGLDAIGEVALQEEFERELHEAAAERKRQRWVAGISSLAAGFVVAAVMTASMWVSAPDPVTYETAKGQRSTIALADGSMLQLNTNTRVTALLEDDERHVTIEQGEAFFSVKRDEDRPFIVDAGETQVRVLGTKFNVRLGASSNVVSVLSGLVSVAQRSDDDDVQQVALLHAGEQAEHDTAKKEAVVEGFDQGSVMAWQTGKALYHETPLSVVVEDLNRYFSAPLQIVDAQLADLPVSGTFNLTDQDVVVDALESAFSIEAVKRLDGVILLYARQKN